MNEKILDASMSAVFNVTITFNNLNTDSINPLCFDSLILYVNFYTSMLIVKYSIV